MAFSKEETDFIIEQLYIKELDELYNGSVSTAKEINQLRDDFKRLIITNNE